MKTKFKNILALLLLTLFSLTVNSQVYNHNTRVKISTVNQLMTLDGNTKLVIHDSNNELKHVKASQLQDVILNFQGYNETGTRAGGDLLVTIGDYDDTNNGIKITIDDSNESITFNSTNELNFKNNLRVENQGTGFYGTLNMGSLLASRNYFFPNNSGTIALTSDIPSTPTLDEVVTSGNTSFQNVLIEGNRKSLIVRDLANLEESIIDDSKVAVTDGNTSKGISINNTGTITFDSGTTNSELRATNVNGIAKIWEFPNESGTIALETKKTGIFDYSDAATATTPITITGSGSADLTNDELGTFTNKLYPPSSVTDVWDASTNRFDFTELPLGSVVQIRVDVTVTSTSANQAVELFIDLGLGGSPYSLSIDRREYRYSGTYTYTSSSFVYMGDINTRDNPAKLSITTDGTLDIVVNGWACSVIKY